MFRIVIIAFLTSLSHSFGQTLSYDEREVHGLPVYLKLLTGDTDNTLLNYKIGMCYTNSRSQKEKAASYLKKAIQSTATPINAYWYLGVSYQLSYKFSSAISAYTHFLNLIDQEDPSDSALVKEVTAKIAFCKFGNQLNVLVDYSDKNPPYDSRYFEKDFEHLVSVQSPPYVALDTLVNEATIATSVDGQLILIYKDEGGKGSLFVSGLKGNEWTLPERLNSPLNLHGWENDECVSPDGSALYFTSDRSGGYGGKDIYSCKRLSNGEWGKAVNLGPSINTAFDEEAPVIYPDGKNLFFSSNRKSESCCFNDFASTLLNEGNWSKPIAIGYPAKPKGMKDDFDPGNNYRVTFVNQKEVSSTVLKGEIEGLKGEILKNVKIITSDYETGAKLGNYHSTTNSGNYIILLPSGKSNLITYEADGYLFFSEKVNSTEENNVYEKCNVIKLIPMVPGSKSSLNQVLFDSSQSVISDASIVELTNVFILLRDYPDLKIQLSDFVYSSDKNKITEKLAQDRAEAVVRYLDEKGINKKRMVAKGYVSTNFSKNAAGKDNLELTILSIK